MIESIGRLPPSTAALDPPQTPRTGLQAASGRRDEATQRPDEDAAQPGDSASTTKEAVDGTKLTPEELRSVEELAATDREVRAHEQAHRAAAGRYATGGISFRYTTGPDGKRYAVGGEVGIDTSPVPGDPDATIRKAQTIRSAANAPAHPSAQDRQVAAQATRMEAEARTELTELEQQTSQADLASRYRESDQPKTGEILSLLA